MTAMRTEHLVGVPETGHPRPSGVSIKGLRKVYRDAKGHDVVALDEIDLEVPPGEFWVLLGPSGCGKTTLLRCIAGLETPSAGSIIIDGIPALVDGKVLLEAQRRPVGMVFQSYALWPHMTVGQNIAYPLTVGPRKLRPSKSQVEARVGRVLKSMQIEHLQGRRISELSGGQQQRVALARAVVAGNDVVLFDEPLSNIDAKVRDSLRKELKSMQAEMGFTAIYVTHDQTEALDLADKIVVLDDGEIVQVGTPREIYYRPRTRHVAEFIGTTNQIPGVVRAGGGDVQWRVETPFAAVPTDIGGPGAEVMVSTHAHDWWIAPPGKAAEAGVLGIVRSVSLLGHSCEYVVDVDGLQVRIWDEDFEWVETGAQITVGFDPDRAVVVAR